MEKKETRNTKEIREISEQGVVTAYLTAWGTVDSYGSTFRRGAFTNTFANDFSNMRLLWNHDVLAGKVLEAKEDETGAQVKVQFNLNTETGKTAYEHIKAGDIKCFSFGFYTKADDITDAGIREIREVEVLEVSPVVFEANHQAKIVDVRKDSEIRTLEDAFRAYRGERDLITIAAETPFTVKELETLQTGGLVNADKRNHLETLSKEIAEYHEKKRHEKITELCNELRNAGLTDAEKDRFYGLLGRSFDDIMIERIRSYRD